MANKRPTDLRKKADRIRVNQTLLVTNHAEYSDEFNPYPLGTLRFDRFKRYYIKDWTRGMEHTKSFYEFP